MELRADQPCVGQGPSGTPFYASFYGDVIPLSALYAAQSME